MAVVAILGSKKVLGRSQLLGLRLVARTGILFLILGAAIGPPGLNLVDREVLDQLGPVIVLGLGWVGFLYGSHLDLNALRKFPGYLYRMVLTESMVTFGLVWIAVIPALAYAGLPVATLAVAAPVCLMAASAAGTAPASLFILRKERPIQGANYETLRFCAALDDLPGLLAWGVLFSFSHLQFPGRAGLVHPLFWFFAQLFLGVLFGLLYLFIDRREYDEAQGSLLLFGLLGLSSGLSAFLHLSPLFVNAVTGATFVNLSPLRDRVYQGLAHREHTFYVLFLLLGGTLWQFERLFSAKLLLIYLVARFAGKVAGAFLGQLFLPRGLVSPLVGLGLGPQGGLSIAMVINYAWTYGDVAAPWVVNVVLAAVIFNEVVSPSAIVAFLHWCDET